jgi:serine/threonine-protein kinase
MSDVGDLVADRYRLGRLVARGGMGAVYEAQHTFLARRVAIKLLAGDFRRPGALQRFEREAKAAGALESEHIAAVVDYGVVANGEPFLVMEYVEGEDLAHLLERARVLPAVRAVNLAIDVCRGLAVAHEKGIVHRDLKPSNVMVARRSDNTDLAKILDFGVAKLPGEPTSTSPGALLGTASYMPPEQARDPKTVDARADLYSVGVMLYEMLTGERPHPGDTPSLVVYHLLHERAVPLRERRPDLPEALAEVVEKAMAHDADARFTSATELLRALAPFAGERRAAEDGRREADVSRASLASAVTATSAEAAPFARGAPPEPKPGRRVTGAGAAAAAVAAILVAWTAYAAWRPAPHGAAGPQAQEAPSASAAAPPPSAMIAAAPPAPEAPPAVTEAPAPPASSAQAISARPPPAPNAPNAPTAPPSAAASARPAAPAGSAAPASSVHFDRQNPYEHGP